MTLKLHPAKEHHINIGGKIVVKRPGGMFKVKSVPEEEALALLAQCESIDCQHERMGLYKAAVADVEHHNNYVLNHPIKNILLDPEGTSRNYVSTLYQTGALSNWSQGWILRNSSSIFVTDIEELLPPDSPFPASRAFRQVTSYASDFWIDPVTGELFFKAEFATTLTSGFFPSLPYIVRQVGVNTSAAGAPNAVTKLPEDIVVTETRALIITYTMYFPLLNTFDELSPVISSGQVPTTLIDVDEDVTEGELVNWEMRYYAGPRNNTDLVGITFVGQWDYPGNDSVALSRAVALSSKTALQGWGSQENIRSSMSVEVDITQGKRSMVGRVVLPQASTVHGDRQVVGFAVGGNSASVSPNFPLHQDTSASTMFPLRVYFDPPLTKKWNESITVDFSFDIEADLKTEAPTT